MIPIIKINEILYIRKCYNKTENKIFILKYPNVLDFKDALFLFLNTTIANIIENGIYKWAKLQHLDLNIQHVVTIKEQY